MNEISLLLLVFFFYFTYLVVLNSIKIKHLKSCLCDQFDDSVKQTIKNINHSCFAVLPQLCFIQVPRIFICRMKRDNSTSNGSKPK